MQLSDRGRPNPKPWGGRAKVCHALGLGVFLTALGFRAVFVLGPTAWGGRTMIRRALGLRVFLLTALGFGLYLH